MLDYFMVDLATMRWPNRTGIQSAPRVLKLDELRVVIEKSPADLVLLLRFERLQDFGPLNSGTGCPDI